MKDETLSDLMIKASINNANKFMGFSDSILKDCPDTGRSTVAYIIFYHDVPIDHGTYVPVPVAQASLESEYNVECTVGTSLENFRMLIHEFLNKDSDIVPEVEPITILDIKYAVCMAKNVKVTNHTRPLRS